MDVPKTDVDVAIDDVGLERLSSTLEAQIEFGSSIGGPVSSPGENRILHARERRRWSVLHPRGIQKFK